MRRVVCLALIVFLLIVAPVSEVSGENDPEMDALRFQVTKGPDHQLFSLQSGVTDVWTDLPRTTDIEELSVDGFLVMQDLGFHIGFIAFNIRAAQSYRRPEITYWPLADVEFRHALFHSFDQLRIIQSTLGYIATPVRSLVPPVQSKYYNAGVEEHAYNPGDPFTSPAGEHSTCGILKQKGYNFVDADASGTVTDYDYWAMPNGDPLPYMVIWTPLEEVAPTSYQIGSEFVADLAKVGLAATTANGDYGILNMGWDFNEYLSNVYDFADFDGYMVFYNLDRIPTQLYSLLHSSQQPLLRINAPGVNDSTIDELCEIVMFSVDLDEVENAAKQIQEMIFRSDKTAYPNADNFALAYMPLYSKSFFDTYNPNLRGVVRSPGFGSDNKWTFSNIYWLQGAERMEDGKKIAVWTLDDELDKLSPLYQPHFDPLHSGSEDEWKILAGLYDGLLNMNPYNQYDTPWIALDWTITETLDGMEIDFTLRNDVYWQDGNPFTAYDIEFCLEFLRDYQVPRYAETWGTLVDVVVTDATHFTIAASEEGLALFYDFADIAALLPPQVWDRTWPSNQAVLDYDPAEPYNVAPGYSPGPTPPTTNLFGTGPWVFQFYDPVNLYSDVWKNSDYFVSAAAIDDLLTEMFWEVGDLNRDGIINVIDLTLWSFGFGFMIGEPQYDADADLNSDGIIDILDGARIAFHLGWQREYP